MCSTVAAGAEGPDLPLEMIKTVNEVAVGNSIVQLDAGRHRYMHEIAGRENLRHCPKSSQLRPQRCFPA